MIDDMTASKRTKKGSEKVKYTLNLSLTLNLSVQRKLFTKIQIPLD